MINFIISSSNHDAVKVKKLTLNYMMNYDIEVKYHLLNNYEELKEKVKSIKGLKVYIVDIDNNINEKINMVNYIRKSLDDWNSHIILITEHNELKYEFVGKKLYIFDIVIKNSFFDKNLIEDLEHIRKNYDNREKCLTFEFNRIINKIDFRNIDMIIKEKDSKKCLIKSNHGNYYIPESLNKVETKLDNRFVKVSRSCIINADQILEYDLNQNKITFKNGIQSFDISRNYKKKVTDYMFKLK